MDQPASANRGGTRVSARCRRFLPTVRDLVVLAALLAGFGLTLVWFVTLQWHFIVLIGIWAALAIAGTLLLRWPAPRSACLTLAAVATMLFLGEAAASLLRPEVPRQRLEGECPTGGRHDPYLAGDGPRAPIRATCRRFLDDRLVFDFSYTLDEHGLRMTPGDPRGDTIVFFGCSFTFGIGLADDETLPAQLSVALGLRHNLRNFAFNGYGPHHMLHALEEGIRAGAVGDTVRRVYYVALPQHVYRAAGLYWWGQRAPRYAIDPNGEARFVAGGFDWPLPLVAPRGLRHSRFFAWAWQVVVENLMARTEWQLDLYEAILRKSARLVRERLGAPLTVVLWDDGSDLSDAVRHRLGRLGLETVLVSDLLPPAAAAAYRIPGDGHPTAHANRLIARWLARSIDERP